MLRQLEWVECAYRKDIYKDETVVVPSDVKLAIKSRVITVEGPRGKLEKVSGSSDMGKTAGRSQC